MNAVPKEFIGGKSHDPLGRFRAVWFGDGAVYDLNELLTQPTGLTLIQAFGINDQGQIVGTAWTGSYPRAVLLTPRSRRK